APARPRPDRTAMLETRLSLLERVRSQEDHAAWDEFVTLYRPLLLGYVRGQGVQPADAEDVVQDILLRLLRALPTFQLDKAHGRFRTWLWQVTSNALHDLRRRHQSAARTRERYAAEQAPVEAGHAEPPREWVNAHRRRVLEHVLPLVRAETQERT